MAGIRRDAQGRITGWFLYAGDPELATLSQADREEWPELAELADRKRIRPGVQPIRGDVNAELAERMDRAGSAWDTVRGTTRWWRRQDLVELAFHQLFDRHRANRTTAALTAESVSVSVSGSDTGGPSDPIYETVARLSVTRVPWRLRAELVSARGSEARSELLVVNGTTFWAISGTRQLTNGGDPHSSHGGGDIARLLSPAEARELFDLAVADSEMVAGRPCTVLSATVRPDDEDHGYFRWPFNMIAGGTNFRFSVDDERGVLLRVVKVIDDVDAEINEFISVNFDVELPEALFAAPFTGSAGEGAGQ